MLSTEDLAGTVSFYTDVLGFTVNAFNAEWGWASLSAGDASIMFTRPNAHVPYDKIGCTGSFYFNTDDVDALWGELKDTTRVCYPVEDFHYGMREFAVYDNNGYLLQFGQEIGGVDL
jgi:uncharacterized glyoxalase superfamily protein PhnB